MSAAASRLRVGYVLKRFPRLSETFILNELLALQSMDVQLDVFSLLKPPSEPQHAYLQQLDVPVIGLSAYQKTARTTLAYGLDNHTCSLSELLGARFAPLFSGKSADEIAALHMKAAAVALRARARRITHLHAHFGSDATTVALLAARLIQGSFSFTAHARDIYHTYVGAQADLAMRRAKLMEAAFVVTVSDYNAAYLRGICPEAAERIHRIYNGIDMRAFSPANPNTQVEGKIIAVGRLVEKKGFPYLIEACAELQRRGVDFSCEIVGDGPMQAELSNQIKALGLAGTVYLRGSLPQESLLDLLSTAQIAVLPCVVTESGDRDGLPTVLLEAMAKALPVITTTVSGGPEIVEHNRTGLLCEPGDAQSLAIAMQALLLEPALARRMGETARARAKTLFNRTLNVKLLKHHFSKQCELNDRSGRAA